MSELSDSEKLKRAGRFDTKNLRLYANLFREHQWQTDVLHWSVFAATLDEIADRLEALELLSNTLYDALDDMVDWHGATHDNDCPMDDTCDCMHKPFNDKVNEACLMWQRITYPPQQAALKHRAVEGE